jgi:hypothetical protein
MEFCWEFHESKVWGLFWGVECECRRRHDGLQVLVVVPWRKDDKYGRNIGILGANQLSTEVVLIKKTRPGGICLSRRGSAMQYSNGVESYSWELRAEL